MKKRKSTRSKNWGLAPAISFFILLIISWPAFAQSSDTKQERFTLGARLYSPEIASDGNWAAFKLNYPGIADTLMVINVHTRKTMKFNDAVESKFSPNSRWIYNFQSTRTLQLINLETEKVMEFPHLELFYFSDKGDFAGILDNSNHFHLVNLTSGQTNEFPEVNEFAFSPDGRFVALAFDKKERRSVAVVNTQSLQKNIILMKDSGTFSNLVWNDQGTALAFLAKEDKTRENALHTVLYQFKNGAVPRLDSLSAVWHRDFPANTYIDGKSKPFYASDGERIYFYMRSKKYLERNLDSLKNNVQIWKGDDPWIVPRQLIFNDPALGPWMAQWKPQEKQLLPIAHKDLPNAFLLPKEKYALLYNPKQYEPSFKHEGDADFFIMDLHTGEKTLMLEQNTTSYFNKFAAPSGDKIAYYLDKQWWIYDVAAHSHTKVTINLPFALEGTENYISPQPLVFGFAGWSPDSRWIYVYDEFDLWKVAANGREYHRITQGRETKTKFRVYDRQYEEFPYQRFPRFTVDILDPAQDIVLEASGTNQSGYYIWNLKEGITPLFLRNTKVENLKGAKEADIYIVKEESYNIPPRVYLLEEGKESVLFQSNIHSGEYPLPRQELIHYKSFDGRDLQGILMYPEAYVEGKKYPMIVHIYERLSNKFHDYIVPTYYNGDGFNPKIYTAQGYFVLYPDIVYKLGDPGPSAVKCVTAAVETVLQTQMVDRERIGLQGQSFAGYESAFIATQTDMFAAIVSSSGVIDFLSFYLTIGGYDGRPNSWWFEEHQWRMGFSYFDNPAAYKRNSPIEHVQNVNTPILLWSGADDVYIDVRQNIEFYLALRRLKKDVTFLYYPGESHGLLKPKNQLQLSTYISNWFAKHLKP